jgi:peptidoglycan/xylan/chitin deacetylase (PgdA/CDA1 family)
MKIESLAKVIFIIIGIAVIVTTSSALVNIASSKSSSHHDKKPSSLNPSPLPNFGSNQYSTHLSFAHSPPASTHPLRGIPTNAAANITNKVVILTFGDTKKSQFTIAKPILDQYGFKASFFITCTYANDRSPQYHLNWNEILALQADGQDIESKGMTPVDLNNLSAAALNYQIGDSKQCLESHGIISPNIFAAKYGDVWNNPTVINAISKYYQFADDGFANLMFLHCDGYSNSKQSDCRTYDDSGKLNYANRYSIRELSHNVWDRSYLHKDPIIFQKFVQEVNSGINFNNKKGTVDAIPIVAYHIIDNSLDPSSTDINLFASEMKYLHDNGFKVIPMSDIGYDQATNFMYIR